MSDAVQIALIAGAGPFLLAAVTAALQLRNGWKVEKVEKKLGEVGALAEKTEKNTNSMKDALVAATASASHAAGMYDQRVITEGMAATPAVKIAVPVPVAMIPEAKEQMYVIRDGKLVTLP